MHVTGYSGEDAAPRLVRPYVPKLLMRAGRKAVSNWGYRAEVRLRLVDPGQNMAAALYKALDACSDEVKWPMPFLIFFLLISLPVLEVASIVEVSR